MIEIYKTLADAEAASGPGEQRVLDENIKRDVVRLDDFQEHAWVNLINPTEEELQRVSSKLDIEMDFLRAALDEEERARIESENGQTFIIVDTPVIETEERAITYSTVPLGIILVKHYIVTICLRGNSILEDFSGGVVKSFLTQYRTRFVLQILYRNSTRFLQYLKHIDKLSNKFEMALHRSMRNKELIQMLKLERSLVYFTTSLRSNEGVLEKLNRLGCMKKYPEDVDLLEDVIIENKQAIEMANIYSNILSGTMDAFASLISNNLNIVMKVLTSVTIVLAIPTMVSSFFGMNVVIPVEGPFSFVIVVGLSLALCGIAAFILWKKKMFR
ncbi:MAG: magnesium transporter CorA family protein [Bacillota bacterium]|nr:magnesium transporter CorA family protein [Bacillota bacterium]